MSNYLFNVFTLEATEKAVYLIHLILLITFQPSDFKCEHPFVWGLKQKTKVNFPPLETQQLSVKKD